MSTPVELRNVVEGNATRTAHARRAADGAILVEGQDRGPVVSEFFGPEVGQAYDWGVRIPPDQLPALTAALGRPGGDPLDAVAGWFAAQTRAFEPFLDACGVVHESWSRVGA